MRLFLALELPDEVRAGIAERIAALRSRLPAAAWVSAERLHVTLFFLGEVGEESLAILDQGLEPVFAATPRLVLRLGEAGTFPPRRSARVAWIGVEEVGHDRETTGRHALESLERRARAAIGAALDRALEERAYHPHVTLARPRRPWGGTAVATFRAGACGLEGSWIAERAVLMQSRLGQGGARYELRRGYPFAGAPA